MELCTNTKCHSVLKRLFFVLFHTAFYQQGIASAFTVVAEILYFIGGLVGRWEGSGRRGGVGWRGRARVNRDSTSRS